MSASTLPQPKWNWIDDARAAMRAAREELRALAPTPQWTVAARLAWEGDAEALERRLDANHKEAHAPCGPEGLTPLMLAASAGRKECVELLATPSLALAKDAKGRRALAIAVIAGNPECAAAIAVNSGLLSRLEAGPAQGCDAMMVAALLGDIGAINTLAPLVGARERVQPGSPLAGLDALTIAARLGEAECVKALLPVSRPGFAGSGEFEGHGPLTAAVRSQSLATVLALSGVCDPAERAPKRLSPIEAAALGENPAILSALLAAPAMASRQGGSRGFWAPHSEEDDRSLLMMATERNRVENIRMLLAAGADLEEQDDDGLTALMFAAHFGRVEAIDELLAAGANLRAKANGKGPRATQFAGETALSLAAWAAQPDALGRLLQAMGPAAAAAGDDEASKIMDQALFRAAGAMGDRAAETLETMMREAGALGWPLDASKPGETTPLMVAAWNNNADAVRMLLPVCDASVKDGSGRDALMLAVDNDAANAVAELVAVAGERQDINVASALIYALEEKHRECAQILARKANASMRDVRNWTPLMVAAHTSDLESAKILLSKCDPLHQTSKGTSLVSLLAEGGRCEATWDAVWESPALGTQKAAEQMRDWLLDAEPGVRQAPRVARRLDLRLLGEEAADFAVQMMRKGQSELLDESMANMDGESALSLSQEILAKLLPKGSALAESALLRREIERPRGRAADAGAAPAEDAQETEPRRAPRL
jgi:ankyrin repeat protein